jgi:hypothetical protein
VGMELPTTWLQGEAEGIDMQRGSVHRGAIGGAQVLMCPTATIRNYTGPHLVTKGNIDAHSVAAHYQTYSL